MRTYIQNLETGLSVKIERVKYYDSYFQQNKVNMKNLWTGIKEIINTKSKSSLQNTYQLTVGGKTCNDPQQMANIFNSFLLMYLVKFPLKSLGQKKITIELSKTKNY